MEPTTRFLIPKGEARPPSSLIQTKSQRDISETLLLPPTSFNIYPPGNRLPLLWAVPTCDLELRVVAPGRVNMQRNQEPRRGRICILEPPQRGHVKFPQWGCVHRSSFPVLSLGSHFQGDHFLPHCPLASDSEVRPGQPMGRGRAEGVPKARQGSKGVP